MDIDSPFEAAPRACDRCHSLKTQCPFGNPCGRCERLGLTCTNDRPQRTRGRPPKSASRTRQSPEDTALLSSQSASPPTDVSPFLRGLPELSLSYEVILPLVQQFLSSTPHSGLYSIIPACTALELSYDHPLKQTFEDVILQPEFRCTLVAIALELHGSTISGYQPDKAKRDRDSLHSATLSFMQKIPSKDNYLTLANVLCLLLLSHTWCRVEQFAEAAIQWCSLARFAFDHAKREYESKSLYSRELVRRIDIGLNLQECVLALSHNRADMLPPQPKSSDPVQFVTDEEWHCMGHSLDLAKSLPSGDHSFVNLFSPFKNAVNGIVEEYPMGSPSWIETKSQLDDYFFQFPEDLLQFSKLEHAYQFEAMIWMHGFFIVLYSTRDIINLLKDPSYLEVERLCHILEHSLLLSEALQPLLSIDPNAENLSPTTIYFICLSSAVQSLALRQFTLQSSFERLIPPPTLLAAAESHIEILKALQNSSRQALQLIHESENLLTSCLEIASGDMNDGFSFTCEKVYLYRWTNKGTGMTNMKEEEADREWNYAEVPSSTLWHGVTGQETELAVAILQLCSPAQRLCSAGFFDLSIMIPM